MIEKTIYKAEDRLSYLAKFPVLGVLPAVAKITLGCVQTICGLAISIIFSLPAIFNKKYREIALRGLSHTIHGFGNIIAGILEGVPVLGYGIYSLRQKKIKNTTYDEYQVEVNGELTLKTSVYFTSALGICVEYKGKDTGKQKGKLLGYRKLIHSDYIQISQIFYNKTNTYAAVVNNFLKYIDAIQNPPYIIQSVAQRLREMPGRAYLILI